MGCKVVWGEGVELGSKDRSKNCLKWERWQTKTTAMER